MYTNIFLISHCYMYVTKHSGMVSCYIFAQKQKPLFGCCCCFFPMNWWTPDYTFSCILGNPNPLTSGLTFVSVCNNQISLKLLHLLYNPLRETDSYIWMLQESLRELILWFSSKVRPCMGVPLRPKLEELDLSSHDSPTLGGHWPRKGVWVCAEVMTPFFQASRRSLAYQFYYQCAAHMPPF